MMIIVCTYPCPKCEGNLTGHLPSSLISSLLFLLFSLLSRHSSYYVFTKVLVSAVRLFEYVLVEFSCALQCRKLIKDQF